MKPWEIRKMRSGSRSNWKVDPYNHSKATKVDDRKFAGKVTFLLITVISFFSPAIQIYAQGDDPAPFVEAGDLFLSQNDFEGAENSYNQAITLDARFAPAYAHRCYLHVFQYRIEEAVTDCKKAVEINPADGEGYIYLTRAYDWAGDLEKAVEAGERAIALVPDNGLAHSFLGEAYSDLDRLEEGEREVRLGVILAPDVAEVHRNLAYWYGLIKQPENKLAELETAHHLAPDFARYLFEIGIVYESMKEYQQALEYYLKALEIQQPHRDLSGEARTLKSMGVANESLGQYTQALDYYEQALTIAKDILDIEVEASLLYRIGGYYIEQIGRYDLALDYFLQELPIREQLNDQRGRELALANLGFVYENLGQYTQALDHYEQALIVAKDISDIEVEISLLNRIGILYIQSFGRHDLALDYFLQVLPISEQLNDQYGRELALVNLGLIYFNLGQYHQALRYYQEALTIAEQNRNPESEYTIILYMGFVYNNLAQSDQAMEYFQQARGIGQELGNEQLEAAALNSMAGLYLSQEKYQQALETALSTLQIYERSDSILNLAGTLIHIGVAYDELGQDELAIENFDQALAISREIKDPNMEAATLFQFGHHYLKQKQYEVALDYYQQTLTIVQRVGIREVEVSTLMDIGEIYEKQDNVGEAQVYYTKALDLVELVRSDVRIDTFKTSFSEKYAYLYERLIALLWSEGNTQEAFTYVERARARAFLDQLAEGRIDYRSGTNGALLKGEQELKTEISALRSQLVALRDRPQSEWDSEAIAATQASLDSREAKYAQLLNDIKLQSPEAASLVSVDVAVLADVQALLDPETTLVEYFITADRTLVFIITHDTVETLAVEISRDDLEEAITNFRDFASLDDPHPVGLQQLYTWLIAPIKKQLTTPILGIVPHGMLQYLPFAALTDGEHYLSENYILFTLPSASILQFIQEKRKADMNTILALGNPESDLPGLHFAEKEVQTITSLYSAQALVGREATETAVRRQASDVGILHLAAHGEYNSYNPLFSTIYLASDSQNDGRLEVHEVYSLDLSKFTDLVVLSACQTDIGALSDGDEVVGLNRAFIYAGTPTVIASLWNVDDAATTLLMEQFYIHLREGKSKGDALRQAQIDVRVQYPHPYYWAAFVLTGDPGFGDKSLSPVSGSRLLWVFWTAGSLLCVFIGILIIFSVSKVVRKRRLQG